MLVIEVDYIHTEPAQTSFTCLMDVIRFAADPAKFWPVWIPKNPELCRNNDLFAVASKGASKQLLIGVRTVHIGGVEERNSEFKRAINRSQRFFFISSAVKIGHSHATETDCRDDRPAASKFSLFHTLYDSVVSFIAVAKSSGNGASKFLHSPVLGWRNPSFQACNICRGKSFARRAA